MVRKPYLSFLLPILLLLAQHGAVLHELGHFAEDSTRAKLEDRRQGNDQERFPGAPCEKCFEYAQLASAVSPNAPVLLSPLLLAYEFLQQAEVAQRGTDVPIARSRGPPSVL
jgi:hypothetical protein